MRLHPSAFLGDLHFTFHGVLTLFTPSSPQECLPSPCFSPGTLHRMSDICFLHLFFFFSLCFNFWLWVKTNVCRYELTSKAVQQRHVRESRAHRTEFPILGGQEVIQQRDLAVLRCSACRELWQMGGGRDEGGCPNGLPTCCRLGRGGEAPWA